MADDLEDTAQSQRFVLTNTTISERLNQATPEFYADTFDLATAVYLADRRTCVWSRVRTKLLVATARASPGRMVVRDALCAAWAFAIQDDTAEEEGLYVQLASKLNSVPKKRLAVFVQAHTSIPRSSYPSGGSSTYLVHLKRFKALKRCKGRRKRASRARFHDFGCPPGIRTPIERVRVASPTIERGGNSSASAPRASPSHWL